MNEKIFTGHVSKLRDPQRRERLQVSRVVNYCLSGLDLISVLDIGTGTGLFAEAFAESGLRVKAVDCNEEFVKIAADLVPDAEFKIASAENLPFDKASFDLVFMGHLLHEAEDAEKAMHEAFRVMRKRLAILEWPYSEQEFGPPLQHRISSEKVYELAKKIGFKTVDLICMKFMHLYILEK